MKTILTNGPNARTIGFSEKYVFFIQSSDMQKGKTILEHLLVRKQLMLVELMNLIRNVIVLLEAM